MRTFCSKSYPDSIKWLGQKKHFRHFLKKFGYPGTVCIKKYPVYPGMLFVCAFVLWGSHTFTLT